MPLKIEKFSGPGSTPLRRRFWDNSIQAVASARKLAGTNVSVREDDTGSLINVNPQRQGQAAPVTCPPSNPCTLDFDVTVPAPNGWNTTQTGLDMYVGDCQYTSGDGWHANHWATDCVDTLCSNNDNSVCNNLPEACKCGWYGRWRDPSGGQVQIKLAFIQGDDVLTPDGWWLLLGVMNTSGACFWGNCNPPDYVGTWLGSDNSIFDTDLNLSISLPFDSGPGCGPDPITFDITFHPC